VAAHEAKTGRPKNSISANQENHMTTIVTDNCRECRFTDCVTVCPVACFHGDDEMLYIDPETCIDCQACVPVCPVQAIFYADDLPEEMKKWAEINATKSKDLPVVEEKQDPLPTAEENKKRLGF
jgi:ferredoxin